ncbi:unnamed protein product [Caenorhabditis auriculariae]|uniref:Uncharacterized protein n=1 Tax=Caenorhabditis auriculariae TaxID=2777116 RepID=A0A8S1HIF1_9PELO|nr:unnamed protein product [Caenorhabditis auriculariae]
MLRTARFALPRRKSREEDQWPFEETKVVKKVVSNFVGPSFSPFKSSGAVPHADFKSELKNFENNPATSPLSQLLVEHSERGHILGGKTLTSFFSVPYGA